MSAKPRRRANDSRRTTTILCGVAFGLVACLGCGDAGPARTIVRGKITSGGKPVVSGVINFLATGGQPLGGGIGSDGTYEFPLPAGEYQVRIDSPPAVPSDWKETDGPPKLGPRLVPEKYAAFATSGLTATVKEQGESQTIDFALP
jgi:hypothetical protein